MPGISVKDGVGSCVLVGRMNCDLGCDVPCGRCLLSLLRFGKLGTCGDGEAREAPNNGGGGLRCRLAAAVIGERLGLGKLASVAVTVEW